MNRDVTPLTAYFAEMTEHDLLSPESEQALAQDIEGKEIATWRCVLSFGPTRPQVLSMVEERLDERPAEIAGLRRAQTIVNRRPSERSERSLERAIDRLAAAVRERDRDREHLEAVVEFLRRHPPRARGYASYLKRIRAAEERAARARNQFVHANLRLVVSVARRFARYGLPLEDLIQEGNIGLLKAVDRFEHRRGYRFSTYATWWVRHMIGRALANTLRTVRLPVHVIDECQRVTRVERKLYSKLGRTPTNEEIASELHVSASKVARTKAHARTWTFSLDEPVGEGGTSRLELLKDPANGEEAVVESLMDGERSATIARQLERLTEVQADIVRKRFGLAGESACTLQQIADQYGLSRERIRQIECAALATLRKRLGDAA
jgi:RNA polymerase primary sigma factor